MKVRACILLVLLCAAGAATPARADVREACARIAADAEAAGRRALAGRDGWLFLVAELRHLGAGPFWGADAVRASRAPKPEWADPLPAILDFRDQLAKAQVELLLVPVPAKAAVLPGEVPGLTGPFPGRARRLRRRLLRAAARARRRRSSTSSPTRRAAARPRVLQDGQPLGRARHRARGRADRRAREGSFRGTRQFPKRRFAAEEREVAITGDLARLLGDASVPKETLALRFVGAEGAPGEPVPPDRASPLLLLGDSHTLVFHEGGDMHARGAGLSDQLALELGFAVDLVGVRGSGATPARINLARRKDGLAGKKLVVWVFGARELTEAAQGWAKVPVVR